MIYNLVIGNYGQHTITRKVTIARSAVIFDAAEYQRTHLLAV